MITGALWDPMPTGSRLDADHPLSGVLLPRRSTIPPAWGGEENMPADRKGEQIGPQVLAAPADARSLRELTGLSAQPLDDAAQLLEIRG